MRASCITVAVPGMDLSICELVSVESGLMSAFTPSRKRKFTLHIHGIVALLCLDCVNNEP